MTTTITILLVLGLAAWAAWHWYFQYVWAIRKWELQKRRARAYQRMEDRKAREIARLKFEEAAHGAAALQKRVEELKRKRTGENLIYDNMRDRLKPSDEEILRKLCRRRDQQAGGSPSKEWDL